MARRKRNVSDLLYAASPLSCVAFFVKEQKGRIEIGSGKGGRCRVYLIPWMKGQPAWVLTVNGRVCPRLCHSKYYRTRLVNELPHRQGRYVAFVMLYDNLHSFRVAFCCGYSTSIKFWRITIPVTGGRLWDKTGKIYFLPRSGTGTFYPSESPRCRLHRGSVTGTYQRNAHPHFQSSKAAAQRYQSVDWYSKLYQGAGKQRLWV